MPRNKELYASTWARRKEGSGAADRAAYGRGAYFKTCSDSARCSLPSFMPRHILQHNGAVQAALPSRTALLESHRARCKINAITLHHVTCCLHMLLVSQ